jgi:hypothetical protein
MRLSIAARPRLRASLDSVQVHEADVYCVLRERFKLGLGTLREYGAMSYQDTR